LLALYAWQFICLFYFTGGDTDTLAFVAGSLAGAECGMVGLEASWLNQLKDWPLNLTFLINAGHHPKGIFPQWPLLLIRNFVFLNIVLTHGFRRLLPPY
jgi:ADP-ribosyl-[dinitrogen reductase] hydrolase